MYTIEDASNGDCVIANDGTIEQLREVLNLAFPQDKGYIGGNQKFYKQDPTNILGWVGVNNTNLPVQSVKDFLEPQLQRGDLVYVSDRSIESALSDKVKRIFVAYIERANAPYICVSDKYEQDFHNNQKFNVNRWRYAVKVSEIKEVEMSIKEIEELLKEKLGEIKLKIIK